MQADPEAEAVALAEQLVAELEPAVAALQLAALQLAALRELGLRPDQLQDLAALRELMMLARPRAAR